MCRFRDEADPAPAKRQKTKPAQNDDASSSHVKTRQSVSSLHRGAAKMQEPGSSVRISSTLVSVRPSTATSQSGAGKPSRQLPSTSAAASNDVSLASDKEIGSDETVVCPSVPAPLSTVVGSKPRAHGVKQTRSTLPIGGEVDFASMLRRADEPSVS